MSSTTCFEPVLIEGHNSSYHDGGVAIYCEGDVLALAAERVDGVKHSFCSANAHRYLLGRLSLGDSDVKDYFCDQYLPFQEINHPLAHAASTFYTSPFEDADILIAEGQGPYTDGHYVSMSKWKGKGDTLSLIEADQDDGPLCAKSLGHFYSAVTYFLGFERHDEWKTMALSAFGDRNRYHAPLLDLRNDRCFVPAEFFLAYGAAFRMDRPLRLDDTAAQVKNALGPRRGGGAALLRRHLDIAAGAQRVLEECMLREITRMRKRSTSTSLCLAGGLALNVLSNTRIVRESGYERVYVQPAAGDSGQALGKLLYRMRQAGVQSRAGRSPFLGPAYHESEIEAAVLPLQSGLALDRCESDGDLCERVADKLASGQLVAWFQGRSEFGPRALGHRSILADPRCASQRERINAVVKEREWFQPFAASVLVDAASEYWECPVESPYMLLVGQATHEGERNVPAVVHVDGSTRLQTVSQGDEPLFFCLLQSFGELTGVPVLLNTSFNGRGQPIVETPEDAIRTFLALDVDVLVIGHLILRKP